METKISLSASRDRRRNPENLKRRSTRRQIVESYIGIDVEHPPPTGGVKMPSPPKLQDRKDSSCSEGRSSMSAVSALPMAKVGSSAPAPSYNPSNDSAIGSPRRASSSDPSLSLKALPAPPGSTGLASSLSVVTSPAFGRNSSSDTHSDHPDLRSPGSPTNRSSFGLTLPFGLSKSLSPKKVLPPSSPTRSSGVAPAPFSSDNSDDLHIDVPTSHLAAGIAVGAGAAVLLSGNNSPGGVGTGKAVAMGGLLGAGGVYGLHSAFTKP